MGTSQFSIITLSVWIKFYLQILDLKAEEFISSMKLKMFNNPPLSDENSDLLP